MAHHDALARALSNVMLNAVDACQRRRHASACVCAARRTLGRDAVEIAVADTGCGIPPDRLARIWDPYVTSKPGGTGLGLAIARQTVLAHDGAVGADSTHRRRHRDSIRAPGRRQPERSGGSACIMRPISIPIAFFVMHRGDGDRRPDRPGVRAPDGARSRIAPAIAPEVAARLERMEQAIDSIAIEVERISEGQRFTTKLLAERNNRRASESAAHVGKAT